MNILAMTPMQYVKYCCPSARCLKTSTEEFYIVSAIRISGFHKVAYNAWKDAGERIKSANEKPLKMKVS